VAISKESLRGYMLEEVVAYLIRNAGYKLLVDPIQDPKNLGREGAGLVIKGRGSSHQTDVLGELEWLPAFTFPIRLIVEAKAKEGKVDVSVIRNAIGVLCDVNQNVFRTKEMKEFSPIYQYVYAVFSSSGFSRNAIDLAIAHRISLIDLSSCEYADLRVALEAGASAIVNEIVNTEDLERRQLLSHVRFTIRKHLETLPELQESTVRYDEDLVNSIYSRIRNNVLLCALKFKELFVGIANGPYLLVLKSENPENFLRYARRTPTHKVIITWSQFEEKARIWKIQPADAPETYELSFVLPDRLWKWIFGVEKEKRQIRAISVKQTYFSNITVYYIADRDYVFRLQFDLERTSEHFRN
jgi:hypothetical protein